jgi:hypothetical protein
MNQVTFSLFGYSFSSIYPFIMPLAINQMIVIISVIAIVLAARSGCGAEISQTLEHNNRNLKSLKIKHTMRQMDENPYVNADDVGQSGLMYLAKRGVQTGKQCV